MRRGASSHHARQTIVGGIIGFGPTATDSKSDRIRAPCAWLAKTPSGLTSSSTALVSFVGQESSS